MELKTERLLLREYTLNDKYNLKELFAKEYIKQYAPFLYDKSILEIESYIDFYTENAKSQCRTHYYFIAELISTYEFIGIVGYSKDDADAINIAGTSVELEYYLLEKYWNKGYASEAL